LSGHRKPIATSSRAEIRALLIAGTGIAGLIGGLKAWILDARSARQS